MNIYRCFCLRGLPTFVTCNCLKLFRFQALLLLTFLKVNCVDLFGASISLSIFLTRSRKNEDRERNEIVISIVRIREERCDAHLDYCNLFSDFTNCYLSHASDFRLPRHISMSSTSTHSGVYTHLVTTPGVLTFDSNSIPSAYLNPFRFHCVMHNEFFGQFGR